MLICKLSEKALAFEVAAVFPSVRKKTEPTTAIPKDEPIHCAVLNIPLAPPRSIPVTVERLKLFNGAIVKPLPMPAMKRGKNKSQAEKAPSFKWKTIDTVPRPTITSVTPSIKSFLPSSGISR